MAALEDDVPAPSLSTFERVGDIIQRACERRPELLRPPQRDALNAILAKWQNEKTALVVMPTGSGKSTVAVLAPYFRRAHKVLVVTPSDVISRQLVDDFSHEIHNSLSRRGILRRFPMDQLQEALNQKQIWLTNAVVPPVSREIRYLLNQETLIVNAQRVTGGATTTPELLRAAQFTFVIVDEAHHIPANRWQVILNQFPTDNVKFLFLTATPRHNGALIFPITYQLTRADAVAQGIIRRLEWMEVGTQQDNTVARYQALADRIRTRLHDLDAQFAESNTFHQAMVLVLEKEDAQAFVTEYSRDIGEASERACYYYGAQGAEKNVCHTNKTLFLQKQRRTLVVCGSLIEGFDHPNVCVVGVARKVGDETNLFDQFVGRAVRIIPNDTQVAYVISHIAYGQRGNFLALQNDRLEINQIDEEPDDE